MAGAEHEVFIGLEIHVQLNTQAKAFSPEMARVDEEPNTNIDFVSLAHPGTLPVLNKKVVDYAIMAGLATNCQIALHSTLARKQYFYPDLPKGYQITQYDNPICYNGELHVNGRRIRINRIHIEEDAGKSIHDIFPDATGVDFNRAGVPLLEIVTEPDLRSAEEAAAFMRLIRKTVLFLGICDGNMQEGSLRCDANISVRERGTARLGNKVEIKNLNSFKFVEQAISYEIARQSKRLENGQPVVVETRLWDDERTMTKTMRSKEEELDYRYFPDPDLPPVEVTLDQIERLRVNLPRMADELQTSFCTDYGLSKEEAKVIVESPARAQYFESVLLALNVDGYKESGDTPIGKIVANVIATHILRIQKETNTGESPIDPTRLADAISLRVDDKINSTAFATLLDTMVNDSRSVATIVDELDLSQVSDSSAINPIVREVLAAYPKQVTELRAGKDALLGFFIGHVMRSFDGSPDPKVVRDLIKKNIEELKDG